MQIWIEVATIQNECTSISTMKAEDEKKKTSTHFAFVTFGIIRCMQLFRFPLKRLTWQNNHVNFVPIRICALLFIAEQKWWNFASIEIGIVWEYFQPSMKWSLFRSHQIWKWAMEKLKLYLWALNKPAPMNALQFLAYEMILLIFSMRQCACAYVNEH